jgi:restriction system protein
MYLRTQRQANTALPQEFIMTYLDAAFAILQSAGEPLHYEEITQRALDQNLIAPQGLTPAATLGSRLYVDTKRPGSRFRRAGKGISARA